MANKQISYKKIFTKIEDYRVTDKKEAIEKPKLFVNKEKFYKNLKKFTKNFPSKLFNKGNIQIFTYLRPHCK